jgi:hypothetical protein
MENIIRDQLRGRTKRLEKYTRSSAKKINCNRATCKDKVEYPALGPTGGKHWKQYKQGKKWVKCTEKPNKQRIITENPIRRVLFDNEVKRIIKNRFAKFSEGQQATLGKYLLSPLTIYLLKNWLQSKKERDNHSYYTTIVDSGHFIAICFNSIAKICHIYESFESPLAATVNTRKLFESLGYEVIVNTYGTQSDGVSCGVYAAQIVVDLLKNKAI